MNPKPSAPVCSLVSLVAMPLLGIASIPFWKWWINIQIRAAPSEIYSPDPGQFGGLAVIAGSFVTGLLGALIGLGLVWFAQRRCERWTWLRIASILLNGFGILSVVVILIQHIVFNVNSL